MRARPTVGLILFVGVSMVGTAAVAEGPSVAGPAGGLSTWPDQGPFAALPLAGQVGGAIYDIAVSGDLAVVGVGPRVVVMNVAEPRPRPIGFSQVLSGVVTTVAVDGARAYGAVKTGGVWLFDLTDPTAPGIDRLLPTAAVVYRMAVPAAAPGHLVLALADNTLSIVDVASPGTPRQVGVLALPGSPTGLAVAGSILYATTCRASESAGDLVTVDLSEPSAPRQIGRVTADRCLYDVVVEADHAYVAGADNLQVFDVSDALHPRAVATSPRTDWPAGFFGPLTALALGPGRLFATCGWPAEERSDDVPVWGGLLVFDVTQPELPRPTAGWATGMDRGRPPGTRDAGVPATNGLMAVAVVGDKVLVAEDEGRLYALDAPSVGPPSLAGRFDAGVVPLDLAADDGRLYVTDGWGVQIMDLGNPVLPTPVAWSASFTGFPAQVRTSDGRLLVSTGGAFANTLQILDATDLSRVAGIPSMVVKDMAVRGRYAYVATGWGPFRDLPEPALRIVDLSDPAHPVEVGALDLSASGFDATGLAVAEGRAYLAGGAGPLMVVDISDPTRPAELGRMAWTTDGWWHSDDVGIAGNVAVLLDSGQLRVVDVSEPAALRLVTTLDLGGAARRLQLDGAIAYVTAGRRLLAIDLADPVHPKPIGALDVSESLNALAVWGDYVYAGAGAAGVVVAPRLNVPLPTARPTVTAVPSPHPTPPVAERLSIPWASK